MGHSNEHRPPQANIKDRQMHVLPEEKRQVSPTTVLLKELNVV